MTRPMRDTIRRKLLKQTRARVVPVAAADIHKLLDKRFRVLKRELRRAGLRKRLKKMISNAALESWYNDPVYKRNDPERQSELLLAALRKQADDEGSWQEWIDEFDAAVRDSLTFVVGGIWDAETRYWDTRNARPDPVPPDQIIREYEARTGRQIKNIGEDTKADVLQTISDWYNTDESIPELIDRLAPIFGADRAEVIAGTETSFIESQVSDEMYRQFDVGWFNVDRDPFIGPACEEICQPMIDGNPHEVGDEMPPYHPNCLDGTIPANEDGSEFVFGG